jgi:ribosomal protein S6
MRAYELMVIFESGLDDQAIDDQVKSVAANIGTRGGTVANPAPAGKEPNEEPF